MSKQEAPERRGGRSGIAWALSASLALVAAPVAAETTDEDGIRLGESRLQPGIGLITVYDSNVYRSETVSEWDFIQIVAPRLRWVYPGADTYVLLGAEYQLRKYWGLGVEEGDDIGHDDLDSFDNIAFNARLDANRRGRVSPFATLEMQNRSQALDSSEWPTLPDSLMHHFTSDLAAGARIRPRTAFTVTPAFTYDLSDHRTGTTGERERWATSHDLAGKVDVEWRFFPKTALMFNLEVGGLLWSYRPTDNPDLQELILEASQSDPQAAELLDLNLYDSTHWRLWFGLQGKFSRGLAVQALFGYANVYFPDDPTAGAEGSRSELTGADGILGRVQVHLRPVDSQLLTVGFVRDYQYTYFSNYYLSTSPYFRYQGVFARRLDARASFGYAYRQLFGDITRVDHQVDVELGAGYRVAPWFEPWLEYKLLAIPESSDPEVTFVTHTLQLRLEFGF